jgi:hypothetical protein
MNLAELAQSIISNYRGLGIYTLYNHVTTSDLKPEDFNTMFYSSLKTDPNITLLEQSQDTNIISTADSSLTKLFSLQPYNPNANIGSSMNKFRSSSVNILNLFINVNFSRSAAFEINDYREDCIVRFLLVRQSQSYSAKGPIKLSSVLQLDGLDPNNYILANINKDETANYQIILDHSIEFSTENLDYQIDDGISFTPTGAAMKFRVPMDVIDNPENGGFYYCFLKKTMNQVLPSSISKKEFIKRRNNIIKLSVENNYPSISMTVRGTYTN